MDHKNKNRIVKLGKILKSPGLLKAFNEDLVRAGSKSSRKDPIVCISKHPLDIAAMSTGRGWKSCKELPNPNRPAGGPNYHFLKEEVKVLLIAYLIYPDDKKIERPIARILLMPYYNEQGQTYYHPIDKVYGELGQLADNFYETINAWLDSHQKDLKSQENVFRLDSKIYRDGARKAYLFGKKKTYTHEILEEVVKGEYNIDDEGGIHVDGDIFLKNSPVAIRNIAEQIGSFINVSGKFECGKDLKTLEGTPDTVGSFYLLGCRDLKSLEHGPKICEGDYRVKDCSISSLEGCPKKIGGGFSVSNLNIKNLIDGPVEVEDEYVVTENSSLTSLEGMATQIGGDVFISKNRLKNLIGFGIQDVFGTLYIAENGLTSLEGGPDVVLQNFNADDNLLTSLEGGPLSVGGIYSVKNNRLRNLKGLAKDIIRPMDFQNNPDLKYLGDIETKHNIYIYCDLSDDEVDHQIELIQLRKDNEDTKIDWVTSDEITVDGDLEIQFNSPSEFRISEIYGWFREIKGDVSISCFVPLDGLKGLPKILKGDLDLQNAGILRLDDAPETIVGDLNLSYSNLKNLKGGVKKIGGDLYLSNSKQLKAIDWLPEIAGDVHLYGCSQELIDSVENLRDRIGGDVLY